MTFKEDCDLVQGLARNIMGHLYMMALVRKLAPLPSQYQLLASQLICQHAYLMTGWRVHDATEFDLTEYGDACEALTKGFEALYQPLEDE